uniref:Ciliary neurotrophic factor n=1 Tax=Amphilophus citrinellus TaxID=61819 RepID=A0A3Q0S2L9_AMPCI
EMCCFHNYSVCSCLLFFLPSKCPSCFYAFKGKPCYKNCFRLTRSTRTRVQQLLRKYKELHLGNRHFEDRSRHLKDLPLISTEFNSWINLTDWERLHAAFWDMQAYWNMLEWKRRQLEKEEKDQKVVQVARATLTKSIRHIQLDLRDLMSQVSSQVSTVFLLKSTHISSPFHSTETLEEVTPKLVLQNLSRTVWDNLVEGYIILRDLDLYLTKLARDFLILASKIQS